MALTIAQKITIAKISEYLAAVAIEKGGVYAKGVDINMPQKLYNIRKSIEYLYDLDPSDSTLESTSNYLYALCARFSLQAQAVLQLSGSVSGIIARTAPSPYQFIVDASTSFIIDGQSSKTITAFIGYNVLFTRNGIQQSDVVGQPSYYRWDKYTGLFIISPAAVSDELFQIYPF